MESSGLRIMGSVMVLVFIFFASMLAVAEPVGGVTRDIPGDAPTAADEAGATEAMWPGQFMMVAVSGTSLDSATAKFLHSVRPAGVILLGDNIRSKEQTRVFIRQIKEAEGFGVSIADFPLVAVDQEGGDVNRLNLEHAPSARELGSRGDLEETKTVAVEYARACRERDIAVVLAPVLDTFEPGCNRFLFTRTFGNESHLVAKMAGAFAEGLIEGGVLPVVKHFPGHGAARQDSHKALAVVTKSGDELAQMLYPFKELIQLSHSGVMVGHISCQALDPQKIPASVSPRIIQNLLRGDLGFNGIVITDDMNMAGVTGSGSVGKRVVEALTAGCDMTIICTTDLSCLSAVGKAIERAQKNGQLSAQAVQTSFGRLENLQEWLRSCGPTPSTEKPSQPPPAESRAAAKKHSTEVARASKTHEPLSDRVVCRGETISSIAKEYAVSTEDLLSLNKINDPKTLRVGVHLKIPATTNKAD